MLIFKKSIVSLLSQPGMQILSADDQSLKGMTQSEAIAVLKSCFNDKRSVNMKLVLRKP